MQTCIRTQFEWKLNFTLPRNKHWQRVYIFIWLLLYWNWIFSNKFSILNRQFRFQVWTSSRHRSDRYRTNNNNNNVWIKKIFLMYLFIFLLFVNFLREKTFSPPNRADSTRLCNPDFHWQLSRRFRFHSYGTIVWRVSPCTTGSFRHFSRLPQILLRNNKFYLLVSKMYYLDWLYNEKKNFLSIERCSSIDQPLLISLYNFFYYLKPFYHVTSNK